MKAIKRPSVPLQDDEVVLLQGGLRPLGWVWIAPSLLFAIYIALMSILLLASHWLEPLEGDRWTFFLYLLGSLLWPILFALWPWLLSGAYWLTTRRVIWKPRIGRAVNLPVSEIDLDHIRAGALTHTLRLRGERRLTLRFIHKIEQVWGGILLLRTPDLAHYIECAAQEQAQTAVLVWTATWSRGPAFQYGQAVLRHDYLAFIPWQPRFNPVAQLAGQVLRAFLSLASPVRPRLPLKAVLVHLVHLPDKSFDPLIKSLVQNHDGTCLERPMVQVARHPATAQQYMLRFYAADVSIGGYIQKAQSSLADHLLSLWNGYQNGGPV